MNYVFVVLNLYCRHGTKQKEVKRRGRKIHIFPGVYTPSGVITKQVAALLCLYQPEPFHPATRVELTNLRTYRISSGFQAEY